MSFELTREKTTLGAVCNSIEDGDWIESKDQGEYGYRLLQISNIGLGSFRETGNFRWVKPETFARLKCNEILLGDVLVARMPEPTGRCWHVDKLPWPAITAVDVAIIRTNPSKLNALYCSYFLNSPKTLATVEALTVGTTRTRIKRTDLAALEIELPPLSIQIATAQLLRLLDDRITLLRETNATLEALAQALFKSWFVDFDPVLAKQEGRAPEGMDETTAALLPDSFEESELGLVPKGWKVGRVADIGEVICGKTPPTSNPENYGDDVPFITIPDMHNLLVITTTSRKLSNRGADTQKKKTLPAGSICVSCIATAGLVARVTTPSQTNQQINSVVPLEKWGSSFPLFTLRRIGDAVRAGGSGGSVFHNLSKSGFEQLKVLFPDERLALAFDELIKPLVERIIENQIQAQTISCLRDTLLPYLISGKIRLPVIEGSLE